MKSIVPSCVLCFVLLPIGVLRADDPADRENGTSATDLRIDWSAVRFGALQDDEQTTQDASSETYLCPDLIARSSYRVVSRHLIVFIVTDDPVVARRR